MKKNLLSLIEIAVCGLLLSCTPATGSNNSPESTLDWTYIANDNPKLIGTWKYSSSIQNDTIIIDNSYNLKYKSLYDYKNNETLFEQVKENLQSNGFTIDNENKTAVIEKNDFTVTTFLTTMDGGGYFFISKDNLSLKFVKMYNQINDPSNYTYIKQ